MSTSEQVTLNYRFSAGLETYGKLSTDELRNNYLVEGLFVPGVANLQATDLDRAIVGGIVPLADPIVLETIEELRSDFFFQRREGGIINLGGAGEIEVDGTSYPIEKGECLYIGRGSKKATFSSADEKSPALFYFLSYPAHAEYPTTFAKKEEAKRIDLGSGDTCNERSIFQFIHEDGIKSCQLVMGYTVLNTGSAWNTMPCHTHLRRSEIYCYFDLDEENQVLHLMGQPQETRMIWMKNHQAVLSPNWSIHSGAGTSAYSFVWAMGGENQRFDDMDGIAIADIK
ncbi:5-dehydro-4-deoxy-D-glucuronate isomerase [Pelagicoccus mobilis]|uniref:4-deoxy-L-threo-5-hexosulose-uronate ketol-isomerase n=1 Tax=Pelagicoccus mobilis TaxID=415221 RepID=A0A934RX59_9BACT|nr:5-dehydro-4-deoxy-D-glucuronate isomerase [Pelagicoccus mobilis]MBK1879370.1 5-dehydro-4-deoxy-D-glucuronate isomerase [Pelagicoccus mobilis]